jgi:exodeoxyribonuclease VII small subunit
LFDKLKALSNVEGEFKNPGILAFWHPGTPAFGGMMAEKKFEDSMKRLEEIVQGLETGDLTLEDALKVFEEGMALVKSCSKKLEEVEKRVTLLVKESGDAYSQVPFAPEGDEEEPPV